ncbi:MAG TPA: YihY/virulence factor BrkB family protein, partial [Chitinophagales bacterium]
MLNFWEFMVERYPLFRLLNQWLLTFTLPGLDGIPVYKITRFFVREIRANSLTLRARAVAYSFFLSLFPAILFLITVIPYVLLFFNVHNADTYILKMISDVSPGQQVYEFLASFIQPLLVDLVHNTRPSLLTTTFVLTIFLTSNGVMAMMSSFDKSYDHYEKRNALQARFVALKITLLIMLLFLVSFVIVVLGNHILDFVLQLLHIRSRFTNILFGVLSYLIIVILFFLTLSLIYYYGPATKKKYRFISPGATVATVLSILAS